MRDFSFAQAVSKADALYLLSAPDTVAIAGGTELLNWKRIGIVAPVQLVDITRVAEMEGIEPLPGGGVRIGALTKLSDVAEHALIRDDYPVFSQAILRAASAQIRNLATIGGNPLQRVRCPYFRASEPTACNKRVPGSGCSAHEGLNDRHAIFGWTPDCVAVHPADPPVALAALDAHYIIENEDGVRRIPVEQLHVLPSVNPAWHDILSTRDLITAIELGAPARSSAYLKIRERESFEYATVSAAVVLDLDGDVIRSARIALGSVAMRPWRLRTTEEQLAGLRVGSTEVTAAVDAGFADARPLSHNAYKITIARNATLRAIELAARIA